jgi:hypothetical protein
MVAITKENEPCTPNQGPQGEDTTTSSEGSGDNEQVLRLRNAILAHLRQIGLIEGTTSIEVTTKEMIRLAHQAHRNRTAEFEKRLIEKRGTRLLSHFANGVEVDPAKIRPYLVELNGEGADTQLFRVATLLWSVPVSRGFGRRLRFLVKDGQNDKLIGIIALGDPVFNLSCRDKWVGWDVRARTERLVNVMDAYVLGAVPPYSQLK